jgi:hypothetical protein
MLQLVVAFDPVALAVLGGRVDTAYRPASPTTTTTTPTTTTIETDDGGRERTDCEGQQQMAGPPRAAFVSCKGTLDRPCRFILTFPGGSLGCRDYAGYKKRERAKFPKIKSFPERVLDRGGRLLMLLNGC